MLDTEKGKTLIYKQIEHLQTMQSGRTKEGILLKIGKLRLEKSNRESSFIQLAVTSKDGVAVSWQLSDIEEERM